LHLLDSLRTLFLRIWDMGFDAVRWMWRYLILGAAVVVPIWLLLRLSHAAKGRSRFFRMSLPLTRATVQSGHGCAVSAAASAPTSASRLARSSRASASINSDLILARSRSP
jgi:Family of unknown function (DUF6460)